MQIIKMMITMIIMISKIPDMYCSIMAAFYQFPSSSQDATDIHVHILQ